MFMRIFSSIGLLCVAACSSGEEAPAGDTIACAVDGASDFAEVCSAERWRVEDKTLLVIRHPDGGFRRFEILPEGRGLAIADGMEDARVELVDGFIEANVAEDRYRIPVKQGAGSAPAPAASATQAISSVGEGSSIACAVDGNTQFRSECTLEPIEIDGERSVLVRHPDGGFRRFGTAEDGQGFAPADGADFANVGSENGVTQIDVNGDVYRIPDNAMSNGSR